MSTKKQASLQDPSAPNSEERRDFLNILTTTTGAVGAAVFAWSLVDSMNPAQDVLALSTIEIDLTPIEIGQAITVKWQGKPVFIRRRSQAEIDAALKDDSAPLIDNQKDAERTQKPEWLIVVGVCTHLGCVPLGQSESAPKGEYNGWFCPCHGSHYDTSGRIRKGPAPNNLLVPKYQFLSDTLVRIG